MNENTQYKHIKSVDELLWVLHNEKSSIINAMKTVRAFIPTDLGEAKYIVTNHQAWSAKVKQNAQLHEDAIKSLYHDDTQ